MSMVATIPCPECGHGSKIGEANALLGFLEDDDGFLVGHRVYCKSCEHVWTDELRSRHGGRTSSS